MSQNFAVSSLECYVCDNQDGNTEKCTKTIKTCEVEQDRWAANERPVLRSRDIFWLITGACPPSCGAPPPTGPRGLRSNITWARGAPPRRSAARRSTRAWSSVTTSGECSIIHEIIEALYKHRVCRSQDHHAFYANSEYISIHFAKL